MVYDSDRLWLDGAIVPVRDFALHPLDETLLYGRGLFETTRTANGRPWFWSAHLDRLVASALALGLPLDPTRLPSADEVAGFVAAVSDTDVVVRLNVSAGLADRPGTGRVWLTLRPLPLTTTDYRLTMAADPVAIGDPYAAHKTMNYLHRIDAHRSAQAAGYDSAILGSTDDQLLETAVGNLFVRIADHWFTPRVGGNRPVLPGVVRQAVLRELAFPCVESIVYAPDLAGVTAAFVTNSVLGVQPVTEIAGRAMPNVAEVAELRARFLVLANGVY